MLSGLFQEALSLAARWPRSHSARASGPLAARDSREHPSAAPKFLVDHRVLVRPLAGTEERAGGARERRERRDPQALRRKDDRTCRLLPRAEPSRGASSRWGLRTASGPPHVHDDCETQIGSWLSRSNRAGV